MSQSMPLRDWVRWSWRFSLEQKGLLVDALEYVWSQQPAEIDLERLRRGICANKRVFKRLWTDELEKAFNDLRCVRKSIDRRDRQDILKKTDGFCHYCGCELVEDGSQPNGFHVDHVKAVSRGGHSHISNLVPACRSCNLSKGARHAL